jgi:hypothetical protein
MRRFEAFSQTLQIGPFNPADPVLIVGIPHPGIRPSFAPPLIT